MMDKPHVVHPTRGEVTFTVTGFLCGGKEPMRMGALHCKHCGKTRNVIDTVAAIAKAMKEHQCINTEQ